MRLMRILITVCAILFVLLFVFLIVSSILDSELDASIRERIDVLERLTLQSKSVNINWGRGGDSSMPTLIGARSKNVVKAMLQLSDSRIQLWASVIAADNDMRKQGIDTLIMLMDNKKEYILGDTFGERAWKFLLRFVGESPNKAGVFNENEKARIKRKALRTLKHEPRSYIPAPRRDWR